MADEQTAAKETKSKGLPTIAVIGIGCIGILVLAGIVMTIAGKMIFSKFGAGLIQKGIESKTGVNVDLNNKGSLSFTDSKTGQKVAIGEQKIPDNFPKDFPVYTGAKPSGTISGSDTQKNSVGFWVVFSTSDALDKVKSFYDSQLKAKGWTVENTMAIDTTNTWTISKGSLGGSVMVGRGKDDKETSITVMLESKDKGSASGAVITTFPEPPAETSADQPAL